MGKKKYPTLKDDVENMEEAIIYWTNQVNKKFIEVDMNINTVGQTCEQLIEDVRALGERLIIANNAIITITHMIELPWYRKLWRSIFVTPASPPEPDEPTSQSSSASQTSPES
jgi:hypothetical protein